MTTERQRLFEVARALGHENPEVWEDSRGRFFAACSCGWESTYRRTFVDALRAGVGHAVGSARPVLGRIRRSGAPAGQVIAAERRKGMKPLPGGKGRPERERFRRAA